MPASEDRNQRRYSRIARARIGLPGFEVGIDCSDPNPARWTWISTAGDLPADASADERPWLPMDHPQRGLTRQ